MFAKFRKHHRWIWIFILALVIPSFVLFFYDVDPTEMIANPRAQDYDLGSINGEPIAREEYLPVEREVYIRMFLRSGGQEWPSSDESTRQQIQRDTIQRLFLIRKLEEMDIVASTLAIGRLAQQQLQSMPIKQFESEILSRAPIKLTAGDYQRYLEHEIGLQQLYRAVTLSGQLVDPEEARELFREENRNFHTQAAVFVSSNYFDQITVTPEALQKFYNDQSARYRIPNRVVVNYVAFPASNYVDQAQSIVDSNTNVTEVIERLYAQQGPESFLDESGETMSEEAAKARILEEQLNLLALTEAEREANDFARELFNLPQPNQAADLETLASAKGLVIQSTEPFGYREGLEEGNFPPEFRQQGLQLNAQKPIRINPIVGDDAVYIIALKDEIPSELPPYEDVKEKVEEDYKLTEARQLAISTSSRFVQAATNQLDAGISFEDVTKAFGAEHHDLAPFSPSSSPPIEGLDPAFNLRTLQRTVMNMEPGDISTFVPNRDGGYVVYLEQITPVEETLAQEKLPEFMDTLRDYRQSQIFELWFSREQEKAAIALPQREEEGETTSQAPMATGT